MEMQVLLTREEAEKILHSLRDMGYPKDMQGIVDGLAVVLYG